MSLRIASRRSIPLAEVVSQIYLWAQIFATMSANTPQAVVSLQCDGNPHLPQKRAGGAVPANPYQRCLPFETGLVVERAYFADTGKLCALY